MPVGNVNDVLENLVREAVMQEEIASSEQLATLFKGRFGPKLVHTFVSLCFLEARSKIFTNRVARIGKDSVFLQERELLVVV